MLGSSKYHFKYGTVTITNKDNMAPNDADLAAVREAMEHATALHFPVGDLFVIVDAPYYLDVDEVLMEAIKPLVKAQDKQVTPSTTKMVLGATGDNYEWIWANVGLFHHGYWARKNGIDLNVAISLHGEIGQWFVERFAGGWSANWEASFDNLDEAKKYVMEHF